MLIFSAFNPVIERNNRFHKINLLFGHTKNAKTLQRNHNIVDGRKNNNCNNKKSIIPHILLFNFVNYFLK